MTTHAVLEAAELIEQRPDERLDTTRLESYLRAHLEGAGGPLAVRQFFGGKANLTYLLQFGALFGVGLDVVILLIVKGATRTLRHIELHRTPSS